MSLFSRTLLRFRPSALSGLPFRGNVAPDKVGTLTRSLVGMCGNRQPRREFPSSTLCSCGCGIHGMHTRGDRELVEFLQDEISAEKKSMGPGLPSHLDDFNVKGQDSELTLTRNFHDEQVTITLNVNHTVDTEGQEGELRSRPSFEVDIKVGSKVMSLTCSYTQGEGGEGEDPGDVFGINELTIYEGEWNEETYCVSGDILDEMMYDLLMNMLEERGVTGEFAEKLSLLCSTYEHILYVGLLQNVHDFVKRK